MPNILDNLIAELSESHDPEVPNGPFRPQDDTNRPQNSDADGDLRAENAHDPDSDEIAEASSQPAPASNLQKELDGARQLVKSLRGQVEKLKSERDSWRQQAENARQLLADEREAATLQPKSSWWKRLMG
jgi:hypothetical protein